MNTDVQPGHPHGSPGPGPQVSGRRALIGVGVAVGVGLLLVILWVSVRVWLLTFAAVLLAIFLRALSWPLIRYCRVPPTAAVTLVFVALLGLGSLAGFLMSPHIAEQVSELSERLPKAIEAVRERVQAQGWTRLVPSGEPSQEKVLAGAGEAVSKAATVFSSTANALVAAFVVLFVGLYLAVSPEVYVSGFVRLFPIHWRERVLALLDELGITLRHWLLAQIISMTVVGVLIGVGLKFIGVPLALTLGIIAGLLDFIPIIGPMMSAVPAILLAFLISPAHALYVVLWYIIVNSVIESHLLVPLVQRFAIRLPPALAVLALMLGGALFGFLGVLLAIPLVAAAMVVTRRLYIEGLLGDHGDEDDAPRRKPTVASPRSDKKHRAR